MRLIKRGPLSPERERLLGAYIDRARACLSEVRKRFEGGLPEGELLYVTLRLTPSEGVWEQALGQVQSWTDEGIAMVIETAPDLVDRPREGDVVTVSEEMVCDWTILKPNNAVEGNFIGSFLDARISLISDPSF